MLGRDEQAAKEFYAIRQFPLLEGESVEGQFVPEVGLVSDTPQKGQLLVLTNHRVISFVQRDGHNETLFAALKELQGVSVKANDRGFRDLFQGLTLMFIGILSYFILGYILEGVTVALALGAAIMFVGVLFLAKYLFWEEEGTITFQVGNWSLSSPYKSARASADVYKLIDRFFQLKLEAAAGPAFQVAKAEVGPPVARAEVGPPVAKAEVGPPAAKAEAGPPTEVEPSEPVPFSPPRISPLPPFSPTAGDSSSDA